MIILAKHEARPDDCCLREYRYDSPLSLSLGLVRDRRRCRASANGRYVDHAHHAMAMCGQCDSPSASDMNGAIGLLSRLGQHTD